jgi:hypothetical protein
MITSGAFFKDLINSIPVIFGISISMNIMPVSLSLMLFAASIAFSYTPAIRKKSTCEIYSIIPLRATGSSSIITQLIVIAV